MEQKTGITVAAVIIIILAVAAAYIGTQPAAPTTTPTTVTPTTTATATTTATTTATATTTTTTIPTAPVQKLRIALVLNGYRDWPGWYNEANQAAIGVMETHGHTVDYAEDVQFADQERVLNELAAEGYDLIWGHSGAFDFTLPTVADAYPNTRFFITGGRLTAYPNVISIDQAWRDTEFIKGALAAMVSETDVVGYQIGEPYPTVLDESLAFKVGAKYVKPDITVLTSTLGNWWDIESAKEAALGMIDQGADVVAGWAGSADRGIGTAAEERDVYYIASDMDHYALFPDALGSTTYSFTPNIEEVLQNMKADSWVSGNRLYGIASTDPPGQYIDFIFNEDMLSASILDQVSNIRQEVISANGVGLLLPTEDWWEPLAEYIPR